MDNSTTLSKEFTIEIEPDRWIPFLAEFTRENRGAHAQLEIFGVDVGRYVETEDRPFDGIAADIKDGENTVWITFGANTPEEHLTHGIQRVTAIRVRPPLGAVGAAVEIEAGDGTKTLLELTLPGEYALPPADTGRKS